MDSKPLKQKHLVLLPGMDGTGDMFSPLLDVLPPQQAVTLIRYPINQKQAYSELAKWVKNHLPSGPLVLLAESFSGPLALRLALDDSLDILRIVFCASFVSNPNPILLSITRVLPMALFFRIPIPDWVIRYFCLGRHYNKKLAWLIKNTHQRLDPQVMAFRVCEMAKLDSPRVKIKIPVDIIWGKSDRILNGDVLNVLMESCEEASVHRLAASHFVAQVCPEQVAEIVSGINTPAKK